MLAQRARGLARPPPALARRAAQAGHASTSSPGAGPDEPAPVARLAALPGHRRRPRRTRDGWRWKIDPSMRFGGFGPWRPEWTMQRLPGLAMPFLGVLGLEPEEMGWGTVPEDVCRSCRRRPMRGRRRRRPLRAHRAARRRRRDGARLPRIAGMTASAPDAQQGRAGAAPPAHAATGRPLLCSTASASTRRRRCRRGPTGGPAPVAALDFTGHGGSTIPYGGAIAYLGLPRDGTIGALVVWFAVIVPPALIYAAVTRRWFEIPARSWIERRLLRPPALARPAEAPAEAPARP